MTTKEIKEQVLAKLQCNVESVKQLLVEDKESNFDDRYDRGLLAGYYEAMALIEDIPAEGCTPLKLEIGQRYKCLADLHYESGEGVMFTKGNVYIVIADPRIGLMSNDGISRNHSTGCGCLTTEYFQNIED